jgi:hypothetical protein
MLNNACRRKLQNKMHKHESARNIRMTILKISFCLLLSSFSAFLQAEDLPSTPTTSTGGASENVNPTSANTDDSDKAKKSTRARCAQSSEKRPKKCLQTQRRDF